MGGKVNESCGCHITVGLRSVLGTADPSVVKEFVRKLARHAHEHQWAVYTQTGTNRHQIGFAHPIDPTHSLVIDRMQVEKDSRKLAQMAPILNVT